MRTALLGAGVFALAFVAHLIWWRVALPRRQTAALMGIFLGGLALWLLCSLVLPGRWFTAGDPWQAVHVAVFDVACTLAYVVAYSALEHRSPSMTLLVTVADAGAAGCAIEQLHGMLAAANPVEIRLAAMLHDGMIIRDGDGYQLTPKGHAWAAVLSSWRRLLGMPQGG